MGFIKAAKDSLDSLLADQWRDCFYCDALSSDVLVKKGQKKITSGKGNNKGTENIISNGSVIIVNAGQCMVIVEQGGVVDFCAEVGEFVYDTSTEPSLLYGNLGENIKKTFETLWNRFTFGGETGKDQRVYYFNTKEIMGNLYGTATPIDFHLVSPTTGYHYDTVVKCSGEYTFRIADPLLFFKNVCGNVTDEYTKSSEEGTRLVSTMKRELLTKLPTALAPIAAQGILPYQLGNHTEAICETLQAELTEKWKENRGIEVVSLTISATVPEEAREALNNWNNTAMLTNANMQQAAKTEAFVEYMSNAGKGGNEGGMDPMNGMMSMMAMNMMGNMMGGNGMMNNGNVQQPMQQQAQPAGQPVAQQPPVLGWTCSCGNVNQGKFCPNCGSKKPEGAPLYKCDKCGYEPEDPANPPKFCPECGDVFDQNDIK